MKRLSIAIINMICWTNSILAQSQSWEPICAVSMGTTLIMGTSEDGIVFSGNNGIGNWVPKNNGLPISGKYIESGKPTYCSISSICANEVEIFALVNGIGRDISNDIVFGGIYYSSNNGDGWVRKNTGFPTESKVSCIALSGNTIFAGTDKHGLYKSTNSGNSWNPINLGIDNAPIISLHIKGQNIYVGLGEGEGIIISTNNGINWKRCNNGLPLTKDDCEFGGYHYTTNPRISSIVTSGTSVFCVINCGTSQDTNGVFLSTDNGFSWSSVNGGLPQFALLNSVFVCGTALLTRTSDGELYTSKNNGKSWVIFPQSWNCKVSNKTNSLVALGPFLIIATNCMEVLLSNNCGLSWSKLKK